MECLIDNEELERSKSSHDIDNSQHVEGIQYVPDSVLPQHGHSII